MADNVIEFDYIPLDLEEVINSKYTKRDFSKGIKIGSLYSGIIVSLLNTGISEEYVPEIFSSILKYELQKGEQENGDENS